jgi:hypothetical protein
MKINCLTIIFLLVNCVASAQNFKSAMVAGLNASEVHGDEMRGLNKTGIFAGFQVAYPFSERFEMSMGMVYSRKGSRKAFNPDQISHGAWRVLKANYIDVPFSGTYVYDKLRFSGAIVPAVLVNFYLEDDFGAIPDADFLKRIDLLSRAEAGYRLAEEIDVFISYSYSLMAINKDRRRIPGQGIFNQPGMVHAYVSAGFKYYF